MQTKIVLNLQMDDIKIPMINGNIDEFESDNPNETGTSESARDKWVFVKSFFYGRELT